MAGSNEVKRFDNALRDSSSEHLQKLALEEAAKASNGVGDYAKVAALSGFAACKLMTELKDALTFNATHITGEQPPQPES